MVNCPIFWIAFCVFVCNTFSRVQTKVQTAGTCKTHADCKVNWAYKYCCGGDSNSIDSTTRMCGFSYCLDKYCKTKSDCGDPMLCCHSNICVDRGCYGCASDSDCSSGHVCCKKSFRFNQALCAKDCVGQQCNNNDDCAVGVECCRNGKCINTQSRECFKQCKSNSECDSGKYCCKKKSVWFWKDRCNETCVGEDCISDDECGPPNECCIAGKCAKDVCEWRETEQNYKHSSPRRHIAVMYIVIAALLIATGAPMSLFWCYKRKGASNTTQDNRESLQNIKSRGTAIINAQPNIQFTDFNCDPIQQQGTGFSLDPSSNHHQQNKRKPVSPNPASSNNDGYVL